MDSFQRHESDGYLPVQRVTLKTFHPYFSVTPPLVCAPANMEMRLWAWPIRQQGTHKLWIITSIQPTNQSTVCLSMTHYENWKDFFRQQNKGTWGDSGVQAQLGNALDQGFTRHSLEKPRQNRRGALWKTNCPPKNGDNQANREGGIIMKNEMPSLLLDEKHLLCKVTSRYTAKFLAGH